MILQSCLDIKVISNELSCLENARIEKFYNTKEGELLIKGYSSKIGKFNLRALRGECIHLTDFRRDVVDFPSPFTMFMRKYLANSMILQIYQPFFERVVIIQIKKGEDEYNLIIELFNKGNIVLCEKDFKIISSLKFIKIKDKFFKRGDLYEFQPPVFFDSFIEKLEFKRIIKLSDLDSIVKTIAIKLGIGGRYAQECCALANVDFSKNASLLSNDEIEALFEAFSKIYMDSKYYKNISPCAYVDETGAPVNFAPFEFASMEGFEKKGFDSFSKACDFYYSYSQIGLAQSSATNESDSRIRQLESRLFQQESYLKELEAESLDLAELGRAYFENSALIDKILSKLRQAKNSKSWEEISEIIDAEKSRGIFEASAIKKISPDDGNVLFGLGEKIISAGINDSAMALSNDCFVKSKKMRGKIQGALSSAANTRLMIEKIKSEKMDESPVGISIKIKAEKKWHEKFRWLRTENDFLLVCGKDSTQNEIVVKKIAEPNDLIFHASVSGSPFGVLKDGVDASEVDKYQSASFILCFSRAWRESIMADVFSVLKEQASKTAPSGEYVEHGSFVISGRKEYYKNLKMEVAIGLDSEKKVIGGPIELIKKRCEKVCLLRPGNISPGKTAKRLMEIFNEKSLVSEDFLAFIPGDCMIELQ